MDLPMHNVFLKYCNQLWTFIDDMKLNHPYAMHPEKFASLADNLN